MASSNLSIKQYRSEFGDSGVQIFNGIISNADEYLYNLRGAALMRTIEEMRRGDATVRAGLVAVKQPIVAANWYAKAGGETDDDLQASNLVDHTFTNIINWKQTLQEILTMLDFGFSVFEIVLDIRVVDGVDRVVPVKIAYRKQTTIQAWETQDHKPGITQITSAGQTVSIPNEKLLIFTHQQEGDNWEGVSILRSAYGDWYYKKHLEQIEALQQERQGLGVVKIKHPNNAKPEMIAQAEKAARNIRANEQAFIREPGDGWDISFMDMNAKTLADPTKAIARHDRNILKAMQVQYIDIGSAGSSGSFSASNDQRRLLEQQDQSIAYQIASRVTEKVVKLICDLNFNLDTYPEWAVGKIGEDNLVEFATVYKTLVDAGGINPSEADEDHLRQLVELPERVTDDGAQEDDADTSDDKIVETEPPEKAEPKKKEVKASAKHPVAASISSRDYPGLYDGTGVNPDDLGCIMLDVEPLGILTHVPTELHDDLVQATTRHDHAMGAVAETEAHVTLLYGLLENGNVWKDKVDAVLDDWSIDTVTIAEVGYFETPDSYAVIAHVEMTPELIDGHERLTLLPHIQTFSEYKPHITLAYVNKDADIDDWVDYLGTAYNGKTVKATDVNYGDEPDKPKTTKASAQVFAAAKYLKKLVTRELYGTKDDTSDAA
ncbi:2'-5' RNA ligase family protein [Rhodococcus erythropolis]|uniref:2'-5' RNA ligase family protein n=1 Tax=Rhodococcus erythropolis TaxID=1833 RepID=UPI00301381D4